MNNISKCLFITLIILVIGCDDDKYLESDLTNFVSFEAAPVLVDIEENASKTVEIAVAASNTSNSERTFNVTVDTANTTLQSPFNVPETVTIPANAKETTLSVDITDNESLGFIRQNLTFNFENEQGTDFGEPVTIEAAQECLETLVTLNLTLDDFPSETLWELYNLNDPNNPALIESGGPFEVPNSEKVINFCLSSGDYGVVVYDLYGDGGSAYEILIAGEVEVEETELPDTSPANPPQTSFLQSEFTIE